MNVKSISAANNMNFAQFLVQQIATIKTSFNEVGRARQDNFFFQCSLLMFYAFF